MAVALEKQGAEKYKIFNDSVHGHIKIHPLLVEIIDTPEFQRLRNIKQLGGGYFVFPGASHNRFEHSIGVAHLAGELVQHLRSFKSNDITDKDQLCVQIAGLCHDLGHGPFSHVFKVFMKKANPTQKWEHEEVSCRIFEKLMSKEITNKGGESYMLKTKYDIKKHDIQFIKDLMYGKEPSHSSQDTDKQEEHETKKDIQRRKNNPYLYEIVATKRTGIDVDKMDYISRDCLHLGMKSNFSHECYVLFARVFTTENNEKHICMRDKESLNMSELFHVLYLLHHNVYQHRVKLAVETMIVDALIEAEKDFTLNGEKISDAAKSPETHLTLTDDILQQIKASSSKAKEIIERIEKRDLYSCVGSEIFMHDLNDYDTVKKEKDVVESWLRSIDRPEKLAEDLKVRFIKIDYGKGKDDPIKTLQFYNKHDKLENKVPYIKPDVSQETKVVLFSVKKPDAHLQQEISKFWDMIKKSP